MSKKKIAGAIAAAMLTLGAGGAAIAAPQGTAQTTGGQPQAQQVQQVQQEEPAAQGSIKAPEAQGEQDEATEAQQLRGLAKVDQKTAEQAALQAVSGTVKGADLGDENGSVVYDVKVQDQGGKVTDVKVDAGNGKVLAQEAGDTETNDDAEGPEQNEAQEAGAPVR